MDYHGKVVMAIGLGDTVWPKSFILIYVISYLDYDICSMFFCLLIYREKFHRFLEMSCDIFIHKSNFWTNYFNALKQILVSVPEGVSLLQKSVCQIVQHLIFPNLETHLGPLYNCRFFNPASKVAVRNQ